MGIEWFVMPPNPLSGQICPKARISEQGGKGLILSRCSSLGLPRKDSDEHGGGLSVKTFENSCSYRLPKVIKPFSLPIFSYLSCFRHIPLRYYFTILITKYILYILSYNAPVILTEVVWSLLFLDNTSCRALRLALSSWLAYLRVFFSIF